MRRFETTHAVGHSAREMFDLVIDVERYPEFMPLCESLKVVSQERQGATQIIVADMAVGYKSISETFRSRVEADHETLQVLVNYIEGPISHLENRWRFADIAGAGGAVGSGGQGAEISFFLEYEFRNLALQMLMGAMFDKAFSKFVSAFEMRATEVYGRRITAR